MSGKIGSKNQTVVFEKVNQEEFSKKIQNSKSQFLLSYFEIDKQAKKKIVDHLKPRLNGKKNDKHQTRKNFNLVHFFFTKKLKTNLKLNYSDAQEKGKLFLRESKNGKLVLKDQVKKIKDDQAGYIYILSRKNKTKSQEEKKLEKKIKLKKEEIEKIKEERKKLKRKRKESEEELKGLEKDLEKYVKKRKK